MKGIITVLAAFLTISLCGGAFAADTGKLGYFDLRKVLNLSSAGKDAQVQLNAMMKKYQDESNRKQEDAKKLKDELEKKSTVLAESAKAAKEKSYQQILKDLQRLQKDAQEDLQAKDMELSQKILSEIEKVVQEYGRKNGYTFIFIRDDRIMYADEKADLTDQILALVNAVKK